MAMPGVGRDGLPRGRPGDRTAQAGQSHHAGTGRRARSSGGELFQEAFERCRHLLVTQNIVVISGTLRFDDFIDGWRLTAENVVDIDRVIEQRASGLVIRWDQTNGSGSNPAQLKSLLEPFRPGRCDVSLFYERLDAQAHVRFGQDWTVRPSRELRERLSALVGQDGFRFVYESPAG